MCLQFLSWVCFLLLFHVKIQLSILLPLSGFSPKETQSRSVYFLSYNILLSCLPLCPFPYLYPYFLPISVLTCCDYFLHRLISHTQLDNWQQYQQRERHLHLLTTTKLRCALHKGKDWWSLSPRKKASDEQDTFLELNHFQLVLQCLQQTDGVWIQRESSKKGKTLRIVIVKKST